MRTNHAFLRPVDTAEAEPKPPASEVPEERFSPAQCLWAAIGGSLVGWVVIIELIEFIAWIVRR